MSFLQQLRLRRAAKKYGRRLGPHLRQAYGAAEHYTAAQIRAAIAKLGLDPRCSALGYAAFMPEEEYASVAEQAPIVVPYNEARRLVALFQPAGQDAANYYESGIGMTGYSL